MRQATRLQPPRWSLAALLSSGCNRRNGEAVSATGKLNMTQPVVTFKGRLIDRSKGKPGLTAPSAKDLMEKVPAWPDFIRSITRWDRVEPGTLTLDNVQPLPGPALGSVESLGVEPHDIFNDYDARYAAFLRQRRGERRFYGAIARAGGRSHVAAISQQVTPAKEDRLEVYSDARLRDVLQIATCNAVEVDVFNKADWLVSPFS